MSNALVPIAEIQGLAVMLSKSSLLPPDLKGKVEDIAVTIMAGQELGLAPMAALRSIHVVKGKPVLAADIMRGLIHSSGLAIFFTLIESNERIATYETHRKGAPKPQRLSFTIEQATKAGLGGDNWKKYPDAMLRARASAALARDVYPDVLAGCYTDEEAEAFRHEPRGVVVEAEVVEAAPATEPIGARTAPELIAAIESATTLIELSGRIVDEVRMLPRDERRAVGKILEAKRKPHLDVITSADA